jgi:hypothetical protein
MNKISNQINETEKEMFEIMSAFKEFFEKSIAKNNNNNKLNNNNIEITKKTKLNTKSNNLTKAILNNIKVLNHLCNDKSFVPYTCTNDQMETFINQHKSKSGQTIINEIKNEIKNEFLTKNNTNFII